MASDIYLTIDGINGESQNPSYPKSIEVESFSFGASNPADIGGQGLSGGKVSLSDLSVTFPVDSSSWQILKNLYAGTHISQITLDCNKAGGDASTYKYLEVQMKNCYVTGHSVGGGGQGIPTQSITFAYKTIAYNYLTQDTTKGTTSSAGIANYDVTTGVNS